MPKRIYGCLARSRSHSLSLPLFPAPTCLHSLSLSVLYNNLNALGSYFCFLIIVVVLPEIDTKLRLWPLLALALSFPLSLSLPMDCVFVVVIVVVVAAAAVCFLLFFHFNAPAKGSPQRCLRELQKI